MNNFSKKSKVPSPLRVSQLPEAPVLGSLSCVSPRALQHCCKQCRDGGSLLRCAHCESAFHLKCINLCEDALSVFPWHCAKCLHHLEKSLKEEYSRGLRQQKQFKDHLVKEALGRITHTQHDSAFRSFAKRHPQCVKQGRVVYPIEDKLLPLNLQLHRVSVYDEVPRPGALGVSPYLVGDLLFVCDLVSSFKEVLRLVPFSVDQLSASLCRAQADHLVKELIMSFVGQLVEVLFSRDSLEDILHTDCRFLILASQLSEVFELRTALPYCWNLLLVEILKAPLFKDFTDDPALESLLAGVNDNTSLLDYSALSYEERVGLFVFLINCFYESRGLRDELTRRTEHKASLTREKMALNAEIKELEQKRSKEKATSSSRKTANLTEKIAKLQTKVTALEKGIEEFTVRNSCVGADRDHLEYYFFEFDPHKLYVRSPTPLAGKRPKQLCPSGYWYTYTKPVEFEGLLGALCPKGQRECKLSENLRKIKKKLKFPETDRESTSSEVNAEDEKTEYFNKDSVFAREESSLQSLKQYLLSLESFFAKYLRKNSRLWTLASKQDTWKASVRAAEDLPELCRLLLKFTKKSLTPVRLTIVESASSDSDEEKELQHKYRKVVIRIWQDFAECQPIWEGLVAAATCLEQLALCIAIYYSILESYVAKKLQNHQDDQKKLKKRAAKEAEERKQRTRRCDELRKRKVPALEHDDLCFFCDDGGELICCETCTTVVHPRCIGVKGVPEDDWFCDNCSKATDGRRQTRSRTLSRRVPK